MCNSAKFIMPCMRRLTRTTSGRSRRDRNCNQSSRSRTTARPGRMFRTSAALQCNAGSMHRPPRNRAHANREPRIHATAIRVRAMGRTAQARAMQKSNRARYQAQDVDMVDSLPARTKLLLPVLMVTCTAHGCGRVVGGDGGSSMRVCSLLANSAATATKVSKLAE